MNRTLDPRRLNVVANHPEVRPWLGGVGELDLTAIVANPINFALENEHGGLVFQAMGGGQYEVHTLFLPEGRGRAAVKASADALEYMFVRTDCMEVVTKVPASNEAALGLVRLHQFKKRFDRKGVWQTETGATDIGYWALTFEQWAPKCANAGKAFHNWLDSPTPHPDDEAHDWYAGAAYLMTLAGNPAKAVDTYNRWARFAGYQPIHLVSINPPVIDLHDAVVEVRDNALTILSKKEA